MSKQPAINKNRNILKNTWWILKLSFKHAPLIAFARLIGFINENINSLIRAFILGFVIDQIIAYVNGPQDQTLITNSLLAFGIFYLINGVANVARNYGANLIEFKMGYEIPQKLLYEKLNRLSSAALEDPEVQNKINRYINNDYAFNQIIWNLFLLIAIGLAFLVAIIPLFSLMPTVTIFLIIATIPAFLTNRYIINNIWKLDIDTTVINRRANQVIGMLIRPAALKEIKLINGYNYLKTFFEEYTKKYFGTKVKLYNLWSLFDLINTLLAGAVIVWGIFNLIQLTADRIISIGQITFFITALLSTGNYIDNFSANFANYFGTNQRLSEMRELLNWPEADSKNKKIIDKLENPPHIKLENVSFRYPKSKKFVIEDLNLEIKAGEKIAIVGENGAGKTTLVKLISNVYPVSSGKILVNGEDLNTIEPDSWYKNLGVLYQDFNTYDDLTAFENIALGRIDEELSHEEIQEAAKKADAYNFIMDYENKFSQVLSERYEGGTRPSTGQWQKIAIARFFYRNAPILILDEPTASIDAVAEANIFNRIYQFIQNKTVIIISHRFATVRNADRIIVFDQGKIIEEGSHDELMEKDGKYAYAFKLQAKGYN